LTIAGTFTAGTVIAGDINSTSDINLKQDIETINNALDLISNLQGVKFKWRSTKASSIGVIAQELESVLPELVQTKENKSVNYNGLIAVLIEAIKEIKTRVEALERSYK
jgi:hypothetical protein